MGDRILARDEVPVREPRGDVVREVGVDGRDDGRVVRDAADQRQQVDGRLEGTREEARPGQEQVAHRRAREVEGRMGRARALQDLEVDVVEHAAEQFAGARVDGLP